MNWYSINGTGVLLYGIDPRPNGRVEFTSWFCVLCVPLLPLRSWSAVYVDSQLGHSDGFVDIQRIAHDWGKLIQTFTTGLLMACAGLAPIVYMISRTNGRSAGDMEILFVMAACVWAAALVVWADVRRRRLLQRLN